MVTYIDNGPDFDREAYLALADEFDAHGVTVDPELTDFEPSFIEGARRFATRYGIPLPWTIRSMDNAIQYVLTAERAEAVRSRQVELGFGPDFNEGWD